MLRWILILTLWRTCYCVDMKFPPGFKFGAATSAFQIEGAWNVSDKGESIWDSILHNQPNLTQDRTNGDVACNSYYLWKTDIQMIHKLGLHFYRFSISWSRILPTGFSDKISRDGGVNYYNKLINGLIKRGIKPVVTLYHFDLPLSIHNLGGWTNHLIIDWFPDYANIVYSLFYFNLLSQYSKLSVLFKTFITINEPLIMCDHNYNVGESTSKQFTEPVLGPYLCNKNTLMAHAKAWRLYDEVYKPKYHGKVSIAINPLWLESATKEEEELTELAREFAVIVGRYSHPIYSQEGGWPPAVEKLMMENSNLRGFSHSRLPSFTEEEKKFIQGVEYRFKKEAIDLYILIEYMTGTHDFYSLNYYTSRMVRTARTGETTKGWFFFGSAEVGVVLEMDPKWKIQEWNALAVTPKGIRRQIAWIKDWYNVSILITENGYASIDPKLYDTGRIELLKEYLTEILLAIKEDGADVIGYTYWSLMDNLEWLLGNTIKFGLYHVDFSHPLRTRTPRASALYYAQVIKHHSLDVPIKKHHYSQLKLHSNSSRCNYISFLFIISSISLTLIR